MLVRQTNDRSRGLWRALLDSEHSSVPIWMLRDVVVAVAVSTNEPQVIDYNQFLMSI